MIEEKTPDIGFGQSQNMDAHQLILAAWGSFSQVLELIPKGGY
ncbi:hypothetical protein N9C22_06660 [Paracoccaceae bacterium]|nr:hypothetical protein [Paracoccaceae bacterium]